jgi:hypothetical protein
MFLSDRFVSFNKLVLAACAVYCLSIAYSHAATLEAMRLYSYAACIEDARATTMSNIACNSNGCYHSNANLAEGHAYHDAIKVCQSTYYAPKVNWSSDKPIDTTTSQEDQEAVWAAIVKSHKH